MIDLNEVCARQYAAAVRLCRSTSHVDSDVERLIAEDLPALINRLRVLGEVASAPCQEHCCTQKTACASCGKHKHTPLRRGEMGGYVCLTCVDKVLDAVSALADRWIEFSSSECGSAVAGAHAATATCAHALIGTLRGGK